MKFDIFFSISQTPVNGYKPTEAQMFHNFFEQVELADQLGYGTAWIAESHLSSEVQKSHSKPVIPHWQGEVGLNVDFLQLAACIFQRTRTLEVGSAVMNILCMGGPVAHAERVAAFLNLHGLDPNETRKLHLGFAAGRFDFMNRASGIVPRNAAEEAAGRVFKNKAYDMAAEIFLRLLNRETLASKDLEARYLSREDFRSDQDWQAVQQAAATSDRKIPMAPLWNFEALKIVPCEWRGELLQLISGTHDPCLQVKFNQLQPVQVFNLSITRPEVIEATHARMSKAYHKDGGPWQRDYLPRTVMIFVNEQQGLTEEQKNQRANQEAEAALGAYWTALEGTLDPRRVQQAANNAVIGNAETVAQQIIQRFHPEDRLMLWFDFFNHDSPRVMQNMRAFRDKVMPFIAEKLASKEPPKT